MSHLGEDKMESLRRRDLIKGVSFLGVTAGVKPAAASYDPAAKFGLKISEVGYRRNKAGRQLIARIYEPAGKGPFPTVLDLHGGAWNAKDRKAEEPMDRAIAESGVLVVAVDLTLAAESPYPACVQDANYAVRWLKRKRQRGMATPRRSVSTAVRAAAMLRSCSLCARWIPNTTRSRCRKRRESTPRSYTPPCVRPSATPSLGTRMRKS